MHTSGTYAQRLAQCHVGQNGQTSPGLSNTGCGDWLRHVWHGMRLLALARSREFAVLKLPREKTNYSSGEVHQWRH